MDQGRRLKKLTANGLILGAAGDPAVIAGLLLVAGSAAATCDIREGGSTGTIVATLSAPIGQSCYFAVDGPFNITGPYLDNLTGAGASLTVAY